MIENYIFQPFRRDRNKKCVWDLEEFEIKLTETICIELLMSKRKWCIIFTCRPSKCDKKSFFQELSKAISQAINKYDNILAAEELNIDVSGLKY